MRGLTPVVEAGERGCSEEAYGGSEKEHLTQSEGSQRFFVSDDT